MSDFFKEDLTIGGHLLFLLTLKGNTTFNELIHGLINIDRDEYERVLNILVDIGLVTYSNDIYQLAEIEDENKNKLKKKLIKIKQNPDAMDKLFSPPINPEGTKIYIVKVEDNQLEVSPLEGSIFELYLNYDEYLNSEDNIKIIYGSILNNN